MTFPFWIIDKGYWFFHVNKKANHFLFQWSLFTRESWTKTVSIHDANTRRSLIVIALKASRLSSVVWLINSRLHLVMLLSLRWRVISWWRGLSDPVGTSDNLLEARDRVCSPAAIIIIITRLTLRFALLPR